MIGCPTSFHDYQSRISAELRSLNATQVLAFCTWCASRMLHTERLTARMQQTDVELLRKIIDEVLGCVRAQVCPDGGHVAELRHSVLSIGPSDPVSALEVHPLVTETIGSVELALDFCLTNKMKCACSAAECMINVIVYEADEAGTRLQLELMFEFPPLKAEFERQLKMIDYLRTAKLERMSLQQLRSFERFFG